MKTIFSLLLVLVSILSFAQDKPNPRPITMAEYEKAKGFNVADLDKDTYVKFENAYILDRYEMRKPYFITGDDKLKKRIDLYKLIAKEGMQELGIMIFYSTETGKVYKAVLPNFTATADVWNKYFEDIHAIDKDEKNFVLKISYVLSKEMSYQEYKSINQGKDITKESATYGNDICFPGDQLVAMEDGSSKMLSDIKTGDVVITIDPSTQKTSSVRVTQLVSHEAKNYALISLLLINTEEEFTTEGLNISLHSKVIEATPNHPMTTNLGEKKIGLVNIGEKILCQDITGAYDLFTVVEKREFTKGSLPVYNIEAESGTTFLMNSVMVRQK
ncbi:hypothetical protein BH09BAC3_BH09BAC3_07730 [soil metagenome]